MKNLNRLGLGTMGMHFGNRESSIETVHAALDAGVTLLNTGEFYCGSESEIVTGEALRGIARSTSGNDHQPNVVFRGALYIK